MTSAAFVQNDAEPEGTQPETTGTQPETALPEPVMRVAELIAAARARRVSDNPAETAESA